MYVYLKKKIKIWIKCHQIDPIREGIFYEAYGVTRRNLYSGVYL